MLQRNFSTDMWNFCDLIVFQFVTVCFRSISGVFDGYRRQTGKHLYFLGILAYIKKNIVVPNV